jgi:UrcA family protein
VIVLAALAAVFSALPAAADNAEAPKVTVKFADLDVSQPHGAAVLYSRIVAASEQLCAPFNRSDMMMARKMRECVDGTVARTITSANIPALTTVYEAKLQHEQSPTRVASLQTP